MQRWSLKLSGAALLIVTTAVIIYYNVSKDPQPLEAISTRPALLTPRESANPRVVEAPNNPNTLREGNEEISALVAEIVHAHSGQELEFALAKLGESLDATDLESIREFILAVPPGSVSDLALHELVRRLPARDLEAMLEWTYKQRQTLGPLRSRDLLHRHFNRLASTDFSTAAGWLSQNQSFSEAVKYDLVKRTLPLAKDENGNSGSEGARQFVASIPDPELRSKLEFHPTVLVSSLQKDPQTVLRTLESLDPERYPEAENAIVTAARELPEPERVMDLILEADIIASQSARESLIRLIVSDWLMRDTNSALSWLGALGDKSLRDNLIATDWSSIARHDPVAAAEWINTVENVETRTRLQNALNKMPVNQ